MNDQRCGWALLVCLLTSGNSWSDDGCFYDGVSQTSLAHIIEQVSKRYQVGVITTSRQPETVRLSQPLGDCSLDEFLTLATAQADWAFRQQDAGVVFYYSPRQPAVAKPSATPSAEPLDDQREEVVVKGIRFIHDPALVSRYASNTLTEAALLPPGQLGGHNGLTAAIGRRAAVTFSQEAGVDRNISVRGMSSDFTRVTVNGMPMLATGTSIDSRGAVNNSRSFDFNVLPDGLFSEISVTKSSNARINEGAIGGSVDMSTPKPLPASATDALVSHRQWLNIQRENNISNGSDGGAISGGLQGSVDDGSFGWLVAFSVRKRTTSERGYSTVRWQVADWGEQSSLSDEQQQTLADDLFYPRHNRYDIINRELTTLGVTTALQWRDENWGQLDLTLVGSHHKQDMHEYHISSAGIRTQDLSDIQVNEYEVGAQGMVYGSFSNVNIRSEHNHEVDITDLGQIKLDWSLPLSTRWKVRSALGYQASIFDSPTHDNISLLAYGQDFSFDLRENDRLSVNRYGFDITDPGEWELWRISLAQDQVVNRYRVAELEFEFDQSDTLQHWFGIQYQAFTNDRQEATYTYNSPDGLVNGYSQQTPGNFSQGFGLSGLPTGWVVANQGIIPSLGLDDSLLVRDPTQQRQLNEYTWAGWWQTVFEVWQLPWPVRGDAGLRYATTRQQVQGSLLVEGDDSESVEAVNSQFRYGNWLPSLHLVAQARDNLLFRAGYSREIVSPSIDSLTTPLLLRTSARIVTNGNSELKPIRSHGFDLSAEWYGSQHEFVAMGLFYNRIDSLIVEEVQQVTLDQLPYYNPQWETQDDGEGDYSYRRPVNGPGTDISGVEINIQLPFTRLPYPLNRFGIDSSYALSHAVARYPLDDGYVTLPPPGLSRHVFNGAFWYRGDHLETGVTLRARSRYLTLVPGNNDNDREGVNASAILGAYGSWQVSSELQLSLDINNITNEAFDKFVDSSNRVYSYSVTGTEVRFGLGWQFGL